MPAERGRASAAAEKVTHLGTGLELLPRKACAISHALPMHHHTEHNNKWEDERTCATAVTWSQSKRICLPNIPSRTLRNEHASDKYVILDFPAVH